MFGQKKLPKKPNNKRSKPIQCPHCKIKPTTVGDLRMHLKSSHSFITGRRVAKNKKPLTEDSSYHGSTLDEQPDVLPQKQLLLAIEESSSFNPCNFSPNTQKDLDLHVEGNHEDVPKTKSTEEFETGNVCEFDAQSNSDLETHTFNAHEPLMNSTDMNINTDIVDIEDQDQNIEVDLSLRESIIICGDCAKGFNKILE